LDGDEDAEELAVIQRGAANVLVPVASQMSCGGEPKPMVENTWAR
jgi:hypothetical protein